VDAIVAAIVVTNGELQAEPVPEYDRKYIALLAFADRWRSDD
jgi:hypothetical protein